MSVTGGARRVCRIARVSVVLDEAVVLRVWEYSETSQTSALLTREHGLVRAIAKGSRRARAPFSGGLDALTLGEAGLIIKPSSELATMTEWDLREVFRGARGSWGGHVVSVYAADVAGRVVHDREPHPRLFEALTRLLRGVLDGRGRVSAWAALEFQWAALVEAGYRPELERSVATGEALGERSVYGFSSVRGGLTADPGRGGGDGVWRVRGGTVRALRAVAGWGGGEGSPHGSEDVVRANLLLGRHLSVVLGREPAGFSSFGVVLGRVRGDAQSG